MLQIMPKVSLLNAEKEFKEVIKGIQLRGYLNQPPVSVTGGIRWDIEENKIKPLSVGDITNIFCPLRRDIYMRRVLRTRDRTSWGRMTGQLVESCVCGFADKYKGDYTIDRIKTYGGLSRRASLFIKGFTKKNSEVVSRLAKFKSSPEEDENWLLSQLDYALRHELVMLRATRRLYSNESSSRVIQHMEIRPNPKVLGISSPSTPDFIIPAISAVGDIKSGFEFKDYYRLAATGYALAYENQAGEGNDINLGLIYYFPTRRRDISFAHLYIFAIDDALRREFLDRRDEALLVMKEAPGFADKDKYCTHCKYLTDCDQLRTK